MFKQLLEALMHLKIGEGMTYKQIEAIIDKNPKAAGRTIIERAIKKLRRPPYGIAILNQRNVGYYRGNLDQRSDWIGGRRDHVKRTLIEGYISSAVVEKDEFDAATELQKKKLLMEQSKTGFELMISARIERAKRLPNPEKLNPMSSYLGELLEKRKRARV